MTLQSLQGVRRMQLQCYFAVNTEVLRMRDKRNQRGRRLSMLQLFVYELWLCAVWYKTKYNTKIQNVLKMPWNPGEYLAGVGGSTSASLHRLYSTHWYRRESTNFTLTRHLKYVTQQLLICVYMHVMVNMPVTRPQILSVQDAMNTFNRRYVSNVNVKCLFFYIHCLHPH